MARQPRYLLPGHPQHVIQRGNNRATIFWRDDDYSFYRDCLAEACEAQQCDVHAYVLMPNHVHVLITPWRERSVSKVLQSVGSRYTQYINSKYRRSGTLWEGRYRSTVIDADDYLLACMCYIELNPVRSGIASQARQYRWSSYRRNAEGREDRLIKPHVSYERMGATFDARQAQYRALFHSPLDATLVEEIRNSTNKGWLLGGTQFRERLAAVLNRRAQPLPRGGDRRSKQAQRRQESSDPLGLDAHDATVGFEGG
ncbi:MAG: transposase [Sulfurifustaceae bacterium]